MKLVSKTLAALVEVIRAKEPLPTSVASRPQAHVLGLLWAVFAACLIVRFCYVLYNDPLHHILSDPGRHWINGKRFFWPHIVGSVDPFMYQRWPRALQWFYRVTGCTALTGAGRPTV